MSKNRVKFEVNDLVKLTKDVRVTLGRGNHETMFKNTPGVVIKVLGNGCVVGFLTLYPGVKKEGFVYKNCLEKTEEKTPKGNIKFEINDLVELVMDGRKCSFSRARS